jgi:hypothetical protein
MFKVNFQTVKKSFQFTIFLLLTVYCLPFAANAQETGGVKGKVRSVRGDGIAGATITARQKGEDIKSTKSDSKGNFELSGLEPGLYNFVFEKQGFGAGVKYNVEVKRKKIENLGDRLILSVDQGTLVLIRGSVFNQDGRSITGAKVELEKISADGSTRKIGSVYTNVSGEFAFRQPEGTAKFRVTASARGASSSKEVEVDSPAVYRLAITLDLSKEEK